MPRRQRQAAELDGQPLLPPVEAAAAPKAEKPHFHGHRERLRERFLKNLGQEMPDYEILEMLLFASHPRGDVKPLAKRLTARFGGLQGVIQASEKDLREVEGVGSASIAAIKLVQVCCERLLSRRVHSQPVISRWDELLEYCRVTMGHRREEQFRIFYLNKSNAMIADELQQKGTVDHAPVYVREVLKRALELGANALILCHNHPSGLAAASKEDVEITKRIMEAGAPLGITVHDHVIVTQVSHFSMKANGLI